MGELVQDRAELQRRVCLSSRAGGLGAEASGNGAQPEANAAVTWGADLGGPRGAGEQALHSDEGAALLTSRGLCHLPARVPRARARAPGSTVTVALRMAERSGQQSAGPGRRRWRWNPGALCPEGPPPEKWGAGHRLATATLELRACSPEAIGFIAQDWGLGPWCGQTPGSRAPRF